jgi:hypothetical protein
MIEYITVRININNDQTEDDDPRPPITSAIRCHPRLRRRGSLLVMQRGDDHLRPPPPIGGGMMPSSGMMMNEQTGGLQEQPLPHLPHPQLALALLKINPGGERPSSSSLPVRGNAVSRLPAINLQALERTSDTRSLTSDISCLLLFGLCLMIFDESVRWK